MPAIESTLPVQTDTLTTNPLPIRMVTVTVPINGIPTQVQMQVVAISDENGVLFEAPYNPRQLLGDIANILKDIRVMMSKLSDMPFADTIENRIDNPGVIPG